MLLDLFAKLQKELETYDLKLNNNQMIMLQKLIEYFKGGIMPIKVTKNKLNLSYKEVHKLMSFLASKKLLKPKYKILCDKDNITGASKLYDSIGEIPIKVCDRCTEGCIILENIIVEFEVL